MDHELNITKQCFERIPNRLDDHNAKTIIHKETGDGLYCVIRVGALKPVV